MSDIPCIYDMALVSEKDSIKEDIINGKALEILLSLLSGSKTIREISKELNVPSFSIKLYIRRLIDAKLIKVTNVQVIDGKLEKTYELSSTDIEILNYLKDNCNISDSKDSINLTAQHFGSLVKEMIQKLNKYENKPSKVKAHFIRANEEKIKGFQKELNELFERYESLEDLDADETYGFIGVLAPYELTNSK